eukprot:8361291-Lingulodinium_polyedra.AAC.1
MASARLSRALPGQSHTSPGHCHTCPGHVQGIHILAPQLAPKQRQKQLPTKQLSSSARATPKQHPISS